MDMLKGLDHPNIVRDPLYLSNKFMKEKFQGQILRVVWDKDEILSLFRTGCRRGAVWTNSAEGKIHGAGRGECHTVGFFTVVRVGDTEADL